MRAVLPIMLKEYKHIIRDRRSLIASLLLPVLMLVLFGYAISLDVKRVDIAVIDRDMSPASRLVVDSLVADGTIRVASWPADEAELELQIDRAEVRIGVIFPVGFGSDLAAGADAPLQVLVDGTEASFAAQALALMVGNLRSQTTRRLVQQLRTVGFRDELPSLRVEPRVFFNEALDGNWFIVPGLIAVIIMQLAALLTSQCVAQEYEHNTIEQILVSPVNGPALMLGKLIPYLGLGAVQVLLVTLSARLLYHVPIRGSLWTFSLATLLYLTGAMSLGLVVSAALKNQHLAMQVSLLASILPSFLLSGFVFPISNMPLFLQWLSYGVPARYYITIIRGIFLKGVGLAVLWPEFVTMGVFAVILIAISATRFRSSLS